VQDNKSWLRMLQDVPAGESPLRTPAGIFLHWLQSGT